MNKKNAVFLLLFTLVLTLSISIVAVGAVSSKAEADTDSTTISKENSSSDESKTAPGSSPGADSLPKQKDSSVPQSESLATPGDVSSESAPKEDASSSPEPAPKAYVIFSIDAVNVYPEQKDFSLESLVTARDEKGRLLPVSVAEENEFSLKVPGIYSVIYKAIHSEIGAVPHTVEVTVNEAFAFSPQPTRPADVFEAADKYLEDCAANPLPRWRYSIPETWVPKGFAQAKQTDKSREIEYWTLQLGKGNKSRNSFVNVTVDTVVELQDLAQHASENTIFTLSANYAADFKTAPASVITLANGVDIVIDGGGQTLVTTVAGAKHFSIINNSIGSITLQNMTLGGASGQGGVVLNKGIYNVSNITFTEFKTLALSIPAGVATVSGSTFSNFTTTAGIGISLNSSTVTVKNSTFTSMAGNAIQNTATTTLVVDENLFDTITGGMAIYNGGSITVTNSVFNKVQRAGDHGSAIRATKDLTVRNSSFINSGGGVSVNGYIHACITATGVNNGTLLVENSYFSGNNSNKYGGAIGFYAYGGNATIRNSYFKNNSVKQTTNITNADGGAIGVYNQGAVLNLKIEGSVFESNTSNDNAGAVFMESTSANPGQLTAYLTNNTFYKNTSSNSSLHSGGAIQVSLNAKATFTGNTFVGNATGIINKGTAVGVYYDDSLQPGKYPITSFINNLFADNIGKAASYTSVDLKIPPASSAGNTGFDYGTPRPAGFSFQTVFGVNSAPLLSANGSSVNAGKPGSGYTIILPSFYIAPALDSAGQLYADGAGISGGAPADQRGILRGANRPDAGAVEIFGAKFDADGGYWPTSTQYSYASPFLYHSVNGSSNPNVVFAASDNATASQPPEPVRDGYFFKGWSLAAGDAAKITTNFTADENNSSYYAIWQLPYKVTYDANGAQGTPPQDSNGYSSGALVTVLSPEGLTKADYSFTGWKNEVDGSILQPGETFSILQDTTLTAQWQMNTVYTVTYTANGGQGSPPADKNQYTPGSKVTVLAPGKLNKTDYTFGGWKNDADGKIYQPGDKFTITQNTTMAAQWQKNQPPATYTVTYDPAGAIGNPPVDNNRYTSGSKVTVLPQGDLALNGYTFSSWKSDSDGKEYSPGSTFSIVGNTKLVAQWVPVPSESSAQPVSSVRPVSSNIPVSSSLPVSSQPTVSSSGPVSSAPVPASSAAAASAASSAVGGAITASDAASYQPVSSQPQPQTISSGIFGTLLGDKRVPLFNRNAEEWALLNLIIAIVALAFSVFILVLIIRRKKEFEQYKNKYKIFIILAVAVGFATPLFFFLTESMQRKMIFVDIWTIPTMLFLLVQTTLIFVVEYLKRKENIQENQKPE